METITFIAATASALAAALVTTLVWRKKSAEQHQEAARQLMLTRELEKKLHLTERDFLAERNQLELGHAESARIARAEGFEQGRQQGLLESTAAHTNELAGLRSEWLGKVGEERERAATEARERLRNEYELQSKLFTVKISPYVRISDKRGLFRHHEALTGYQYQLLINGIPAFTPHVVIERTEIKKELNEKVEKLLLDSAQLAADAAIQMYLGGAPQFARRAPPLVERGA